MKFSIKYFFNKFDQTRKTSEFITFTEIIFNG